MPTDANSAGLRAALQQLMKHTRPESDGIARADRSKPLPLSFAQQRLWLVDQLSPGSAAYNVPFAVRVRGGLDVGVLGGALSVLVGRHEVLRTVFR
ncbi:condensation domain-containing protein, partial [Kitasatospora sp. NPDC058218]|uniref:condensation domain-containing protein n=1 Tax=Kitasatospora sp. NPDC058218 TaxID=3346385 RepID=UPI0036DD5AC7